MAIRSHCNGEPWQFVANRWSWGCIYCAREAREEEAACDESTREVQDRLDGGAVYRRNLGRSEYKTCNVPSNV